MYIWFLLIRSTELQMSQRLFWNICQLKQVKSAIFWCKRHDTHSSISFNLNWSWEFGASFQVIFKNMCQFIVPRCSSVCLFPTFSAHILGLVLQVLISLIFSSSKTHFITLIIQLININECYKILGDFKATAMLLI